MKLSTEKKFTHKAKDYTSFYNEEGEPRVNIEGIVEVSGGAGSGGGGSSTYSNASGDFTATPTVDAKTITISGLPFTLEDKHVVFGSIKKIDSSGNVSSVLTTNVSVSAGVITLSDADNFVTGDSVVVTLIGPDKAYDSTLDVDKVSVSNPDFAHYTTVENIISATNDAVANYYYSPEIFMDGYQNLAIQLTGSTGGSGVVFKIYATLNSSASTPTAASAPSADWIDVSTYIFGSPSITLNSGNSNLFYTDGKMPYKYIISYDIDNATNATDIFIRKY